MAKVVRDYGSNWKRKIGLLINKKYELIDGKERNRSYSIRFINEINMRNIVDMADEGQVFDINKISETDRVNDFNDAGVDNVILSLNKSYELSGDKKMGALKAIMFSAVSIFSTTSNAAFLKFNPKEPLYLALMILCGITTIYEAGTAYFRFHQINNIASYTKEAELHILDVKPEAMKDLLQEKYKNTTGARVKSLFKRNKKKEEI
jgi:hypothetical protein